MKFLKAILFTGCMLCFGTVFSQTTPLPFPKGPWKAFWINMPNEPTTEYGVYHFRKNIKIQAKPSTFRVHVSADNRYKLYVNQQLVSLGPARGDTYYWNFETVDLAPYLTVGDNTIAALVWDEGAYRPEPQISIRTAFIMQGNSEQEEIVNTNESWKCTKNNAYKPLVGIGYSTYYVAGPGEFVDMNHSIKNWQAPDYNDSGWKNAAMIDAGNPKGTVNAFNWMLVPSSLPQMELKTQRIATVRKAEGINAPPSFPAEKTAITIPANTSATLLLDQGFLTNAYVTANFSGGKNASITLGYAESMFSSLGTPEGMVKGNRNEINGKIFAGRRDSIIVSGALAESFTTLYWRTYRYIQLKIVTRDEPLVLDDIYGTFTGYPFELKAKLKTENPEMQNILDIGWRTARLCAWETYFDCPYYEQLQYIGDSRIQAMISYYNSGDDLMARNAMNQMDQSRIAEGITLSRHPSFSPQIISTFSLWYIGMLHDYWMYRNDSDFVKEKLTGVRAILDFFSKYQQADGSLKDTPYWTFADWTDSKQWTFGMAPKSANGNSAILDLQLLWAYQLAAQMEEKMGMQALAADYHAKALQLATIIQKKYWNTAKQLYADTEDQQLYSQHTNSLAILTGMVSNAGALGQRLLTDPSLVQCSIYFKYYLHQALAKAGLGNDYLNWLDIWHKNIEMGMSTWAETSDLEHTRSDCHAWGSSPNIEFYRTILGIDSDEPGFQKIRIEPHPGNLKNLSGEIPHPNGKISVNYKIEKTKCQIQVSLPAQTTGRFVWKGKEYALKAGNNKLIVP